MIRTVRWLMLLSFPAFAEPTLLKGVVAERLDAAGYSYLRVAAPTGDEWAAVPQTEVAKGTPVTIEVQARMQNFQSKTLNRTWPVIAFGTMSKAASAEAGKGAVEQPKPAIDNPHARGLPTTFSSPSLAGTVLERLEANSYTYLRLKLDPGETWAAVPRAEVAVGARVRIKNPQNMDGFTSPSLKRTFSRIVFGVLESSPSSEK